MNPPKDIAKEVAATIAVAEQISPVLPPPFLQAKILGRLSEQVTAPAIPIYRRLWLPLAAASVILALNVVILRNVFRQNQDLDSAVMQADPIQQIQAYYQFDQTNF